AGHYRWPPEREEEERQHDHERQDDFDGDEVEAEIEAEAPAPASEHEVLRRRRLERGREDGDTVRHRGCSRKYQRSAWVLGLARYFISKPSNTMVAGTNAAVNATGENQLNVFSPNSSAANTAIRTAKPPSPTAKM